jgi:hypothetical protein
MQPEAGVLGPLLAIAFILGTAIFRSLSERSGQVPASTLTNSVANDPSATLSLMADAVFRGKGWVMHFLPSCIAIDRWNNPALKAFQY